MTFSILVSRRQSNSFLRDKVLLVRFSLQLALVFLFFLVLSCCWVCSSRLLLAVLFSPAVGGALLACCWRCSSRLLLAVLFCIFCPLSEILVDLLLVVIQVLRLCVPFRQSGFASFVDIFSPLALLAVVLSVLSSGVASSSNSFSLLRSSPLAPPTPLLGLRHFVTIGSRWGDSLPLRFVGGLQHHCVILFHGVVLLVRRLTSLTEVLASCAARFERCYMSLSCHFHALLPFT